VRDGVYARMARKVDVGCGDRYVTGYIRLAPRRVAVGIGMMGF
jgi:hypothetical protein